MITVLVIDIEEKENYTLKRINPEDAMHATISS